MRGRTHGRVVLLLALLATTAAAPASLVTSFQFNGRGNWSVDATGSNNIFVGQLTAVVPAGSSVEKAFLYSSMTPFVAPTVIPEVDFDGTLLSGDDWTSLGFNDFGLRAFRADVTAQVATKVGEGATTPFTFDIADESPNPFIDGEVLAIVFSNPDEKERTIAFQDGFSETTGDTTSIRLAAPLTSTELADPEFEASMSAGIGFGRQGDAQFSQIDVNGERLTTSAGGQDDGVLVNPVNGELITVGGVGDDSANPVDPFAMPSGDPRIDDELYTLTPFLSAGDTEIIIDTLNPSNDDNIFFLGFNATAVADVSRAPPGAAVAEPGTVLLLGAGVVGLAAVGRRRRR